MLDRQNLVALMKQVAKANPSAPVAYSWKRTSKNYDELGRGDWLNRKIVNETEIPFMRRRIN